MKHRVIVAAVIRNPKNEILLCKMPKDRGIFPGQWVIPGGGMEEGEKMEAALHREVWEEVGLKLTQWKPVWFKDDERVKLYSDGTREKHYMIYLVFEGKVADDKVKPNEEFEAYKWVRPTRLKTYDLCPPSVELFKDMGWL